MENIFRDKDFLLSCGPSNVHKFAFCCDLSILLLLIEMNFVPEIIGCGVEILGCRPTVLTSHGMTCSLFQFILFFHKVRTKFIFMQARKQNDICIFDFQKLYEITACLFENLFIKKLMDH